jgi:hypothetical protein
MLSGPWKVSMFSGPWKVPLLGGPWKEKEKEKEKHLFHLFPLSHQQIVLKLSFFPWILRFYFTMVLGRYLCISFIFLDLNYNHAF